MLRRESDWSGREQAQGELSLARVALAEGDLKHVANHVAGALGYDPTLPEIHNAPETACGWRTHRPAASRAPKE